MIRIMPSLVAALAACTSAPQESAMQSSSENAASLEAAGRLESGSKGLRRSAVQAGSVVTEKQEAAVLGPVPEPVSAAENPLHALPRESSAEARGRRTLSTAFVMVGADGRLTVELHDGRVLVLRDVAMRRKDYCGVQVLGVQAGTRYCGEYATVAAARPGGTSSPKTPDLAPSNRLELPARAAKTE